jgi:hypothetical protein
MSLDTNEQQQRLKRTSKWPSWLRAPFLLKWAFFLGPFVARFVRFWLRLNGEDPDS